MGGGWEVVGRWLGGGWERGWELLYYSEASLELLEPLFYMEESWLGAWLGADVLHGGVVDVAGVAVLHGGVTVGWRHNANLGPAALLGCHTYLTP